MTVAHLIIFVAKKQHLVRSLVFIAILFLSTLAHAQTNMGAVTAGTPLIMTCFSANIRVHPSTKAGQNYDRIFNPLRKRDRLPDLELYVNGKMVGSTFWNSLKASYTFSVINKKQIELIVKDRDLHRRQVIMKATVSTDKEQRNITDSQAVILLKKIPCN